MADTTENIKSIKKLDTDGLKIEYGSVEEQLKAQAWNERRAGNICKFTRGTSRRA